MTSKKHTTKVFIRMGLVFGIILCQVVGLSFLDRNPEKSFLKIASDVEQEKRSSEKQNSLPFESSTFQVQCFSQLSPIYIVSSDWVFGSTLLNFKILGKLYRGSCYSIHSLLLDNYVKYVITKIVLNNAP